MNAIKFVRRDPAECKRRRVRRNNRWAALVATFAVVLFVTVVIKTFHS